MMTEPSDLSAAKAKSVEKSWVTPDWSSLLTELLSPPALESPQVMTEPSDLSAAKALLFLNSCVVRPGDAGVMGVVCSFRTTAVAVMAVLPSGSAAVAGTV